MIEPAAAGPQRFVLKPSDQIVVVGPKRSGKSNLIAWFLADIRSWVVIDSKQHPTEWSSWGPRHGAVVTGDPDAIARHPRVVFQPNNNDLLSSPDWRKPNHPWTRALQLIFARGNTTVVFDETVQTLPANGSHRDALRIYTQGGAPGLQIWAGTQFANRIDTMTTRQADHCFAMRMLSRDEKLLTEARGVPFALSQLGDYEFGYHLSSTPSWVRCPPVDHVL